MRPQPYLSRTLALPYLIIFTNIRRQPYLILALSVKENPSRLLLWLFQSIKSPVVADFSFLVGLNAQPYLTQANI